MPIVPSSEKGNIDFQQLSIECFSRNNSRVDLQYLECIKDAQKKLREETNRRIPEKVFLNGNSSSGVFAQRFALIHPEIVDSCCIGGAAGSVPIPISDIGYPIGIGDYEKLFGKKFDFEEYRKINFAYYVGEHENSDPGNWDFDGNYIAKDSNGKQIDKTKKAAPMHDMSYRGKSVPTDVGKKQRELFR
jgi:pimeloyl-ACP methyl ester carboxylesterase